MNDNILSTAVFALVVTLALGAAALVCRTEIDLERAGAQAAMQPAPASAPEMVTLPAVVVTGHRAVQLAPDAGDDVVALVSLR